MAKGREVCPLTETLIGDPFVPTKREYLLLTKEQRERLRAKAETRKAAFSQGQEKGKKADHRGENNLTILNALGHHDKSTDTVT